MSARLAPISRPQARSAPLSRAPSNVLEVRPITTRTPLDVAYMRGQKPLLVVAFSGVGNTRVGTPPFEFMGTASGYGDNHALLVSDPLRCWMNHEGYAEELVEIIEGYVKAHNIETVATLGNSMGGFMALVIAGLTKVDCAIAFAPQYSMHPELVPEETRWQFVHDGVKTWTQPDVGTLAAQRSAYYIFHCSHPMEAQHWLRFPWRPEISHFLFQSVGHDLARRMQKRKLIMPAIQSAIAGKPRQLRKHLQKSLIGRRFEVFRREDYQAAHPGLSVGPQGAPMVVPSEILQTRDGGAS